MQASQALRAAARTNGNGNGHHNRLTPATITKRDGTIVPYDSGKIENAAKRCCESIGIPPDKAATLAVQIREGVENLLLFAPSPLTVESVQDRVETTLMTLGLHEAARHYVLYRDERRRVREAAAVSPEVAAAVAADAAHFAYDVQRFQHYDKYARFEEHLGRRETFVEQVDRVVGHLQWLVEVRCPDRDPAAWGDSVFDGFRRSLLAGEATPSMRMMQMAGPAARRCDVCTYNCAFIGADCTTAFAEILYVLMQGTGEGFSVEYEFVGKLPRVQRRKPDVLHRFQIPDSTEGWCDSLKFGLTKWFAGEDVEFDYSLIRPEGTVLRTKGGRASGPGPLKALHDFARKVIFSRERKRLRTIDVHDILCMVGQIVQVGGVRRAACISLSDLDDTDMRYAKHGEFWSDPAKKQRTMANNSAVYEEKPSAEEFLEEWLALVKSRSGERGIFNREAAHRMLPARRRRRLRKGTLLGTNPCGEILLDASGQFCNLSIAVVRPTDTEEDLHRKVSTAAVLGTIQSAATKFRYLRPQWAENCIRERLLGVDLLGAMDCPLLRADNPDRDALLERLRDTAVRVNRETAATLGIEESAAVTCIKPGGNSSVRWYTGQSMSGWLAKHMLRRTEVSKISPMHAFLAESGVPHETCYRDPNTSVFSWPMEAPEGAQIVADLDVDASGEVTAYRPRRGALEQLEDWKAFKLHWTEHNPSCTIYVAPEEWLAVGNWVYENWDIIGGLSFAPLDGGIYPQAPLCPVTEETYRRFVASFPKLDWSKLSLYETDSSGLEGQREFACSGDTCLR